MTSGCGCGTVSESISHQGMGLTHSSHLLPAESLRSKTPKFSASLLEGTDFSTDCASLMMITLCKTGLRRSSAKLHRRLGLLVAPLVTKWNRSSKAQFWEWIKPAIPGPTSDKQNYLTCPQNSVGFITW